ncbi:hypothetical protein [Paraburkholderia sp. J63]|uniref:hypothetical protein n=1 Tax=Paraburkholderia sp. J63 TaxID=2805434 RepID=UPI002ABE195B|nr:hypothetical protein [Paraburkholderia sp. J63]
MEQENFPSRITAFKGPSGISFWVRLPFIGKFNVFSPRAISGVFKTRLSHLEIKKIGLYYTARWGISKTLASVLELKIKRR